MLRMVIFDFDGVIADSEKAHFEMFRQSLLDEGIEMTWPQYCERYLGYTDYECIEQVLIDNGRQVTKELIERLFQNKKVKFARHIETNSLIMPGVRELLEDLRGNQIICSICSGALTDELEFMLQQSDLRQFFAFIVSADNVSRGKPDPEGFNLCISKINSIIKAQSPATSTDNPAHQSLSDQPIRPDECVIIEDSMWGIQAARAAAIRSLAVATSYPAEKLHDAEMVADDLTTVSTESLRRLLDLPG